jgi:hypothetical protein
VYDPDEAEEFHRALLEVSSLVAGIPVDDLAALRKRIVARFRGAGTGIVEGLSEDLTEEKLIPWHLMLFGSGHLSPEWLAGEGSQGWGRFRMKMRMVAFERAGGDRDQTRWLDTRKLMWAEAASKTVGGSASEYYDLTFSPTFGKHGEATLSLFPWGGPSQADARGQAGSLAGGEWRYVAFSEEDWVQYPITVQETLEMYSSVPGASGVTRQTGVTYVKIPVDEVPRLEEIGRAAAEIVRLRRAMRGAGTAEQWAQLRAVEQRLKDLGDTDGPPVTDRVPPPSVAQGLSRGMGVVDLLPGAEKIIPTALADLRRSEAGPQRNEREWLDVEAGLARLISSLALLPLSSLLIAGTVHVHILTITPTGVYAEDIGVRWVQAPEQPGISRKTGGVIDHFPADYADSTQTDTATSGISAGMVPTFIMKLHGDEKKSATYGFAFGYSYSGSLSRSSSVGVQTWASQPWRYEGTLLKSFASGEFEVETSVKFRPAVLGTPQGLARITTGGVKYLTGLLKSMFAEEPGTDAGGEAAPADSSFGREYHNTVRIKGKLRNSLPESASPRTGQPVPSAGPMVRRAQAITGTSRLAGLIGRPVTAASGEFTPEELGTAGQLGPDDRVVGVPGLPAVREEMETMAATAGIPADLTRRELDDKFNADQVEGRLFGGGPAPATSFTIVRGGG